ncbi:hypothetical protein VTJ04DRAFT_6827 [Mycothermus thermophilus]|uniref:uncharacterized protein n=1 Tax=Humicola insolens TaxID=85995 RepID=UPI003743AC9F
MHWYTESLATLQVGRMDFEVAESLIRDISILDDETFSLEQALSIAFQQVGNGWMGIVWHDAGSPLIPNDDRPWAFLHLRSTEPLEMSERPLEDSYFPTPTHKPGVVTAARGTSPGNIKDTQPTLIECIINEYPDMIDLHKAVDEPLYALSPLFDLSIVCEMELLYYIEAMVNHDRTATGWVYMKRPERVLGWSHLSYLQEVLKRHIQYLRSVIGFMKRQSAVSSTTSSPFPSTSPDTLDTLLHDYEYALEYAENILRDCSEGITVFAHVASIHESEKAIQESRDVTRLTRLATVFVPLSFMTSVFGMNTPEFGEENGPALWVWVLASALLGLATLVILQRKESACLRQHNKNAVRTRPSLRLFHRPIEPHVKVARRYPTLMAWNRETSKPEKKEQNQDRMNARPYA